ncbi:unnamed protein product [Arabidopsis halleri]
MSSPLFFLIFYSVLLESFSPRKLSIEMLLVAILSMWDLTRRFKHRCRC